MKDVIIVGGGLAGLVNAIVLARAGLQVVLIEKKQYPFHKVCGEYISNEVLPFFHSLGIFPEQLGASAINRLQVSSPSGNNVLNMPLDLGGFGISRYTLDHHLYQIAVKAGVTFILGKTADNIDFKTHFQVQLSDGTQLESNLVIGAFGKRSKLDKQLNRDFINKRSPYVGVKYHIQTVFPRDLIALHNFQDGYCGVCAIEEGKYNLCYLTSRDNIKRYGSIEEMEKETLYKNPFMQAIRQNARFLYEKPEVINEISFSPKKAVENHILMSGDTAGLITPLCGNGMAMAIHSAKILSGLIILYFKEQWTKEKLEMLYQQQWKQTFATRLWVGRQTQRLFGSEWLSSMAVRILKTVKPAARLLVKHTHGEVF
ncbi:NAD(P)/FAD-dependent oxidoreductase [Rhodocytophaga rosea]|uniref:NAD(P)/FAD-dependent oxidoreductase n=1 Tax=Rhodocytophaga rosea TaxID=2704465 RepID=A0A6C0GCP8_9BACT|nr:NAD(P)/FAD-dependent oxidoreductase [Rhodocytophaga rosea]QHT65593.1 NAD(P)/FAD-dependent oxidoreductase [Rhodocytophaga rosea]